MRRNDQYTLRCEVEGDKPMEIAWRLKGGLIDFKYATRHQLKRTSHNNGAALEMTIMPVILSDRGEYICYASNTFGNDHASVKLQVQEPPSSPTNLHYTEVGSRHVMIAWSRDSQSMQSGTHSQPVTGYILQFKEADDVWHDHSNRKLLPGDRALATAKVAPLKPAVTYHFRMYAENSLGISAPSDILQVQTHAEAPSGPPTKVTVKALASDQLLVTWRPPEHELWNGELLGYTIGFRKASLGGNNHGDSSIPRHHQHDLSDFNFTKMSITGGDMGNDFRLTGLEKYTKYLVIVRAFNVKGDGPASEPIQVQTLEDVPSAPIRTSCIPLTSRNIQVTWEPPPKHKQYGIIQGYKILYEPEVTNALVNIENGNINLQETKITSTSTAVLHGLYPYTNYSVQVLAFTRAGEGEISPITYCKTEESVPDAPEYVKACASNDMKVILSWLPPRRPNGILTKYQVYIRVLEKGGGQETKIIKENLLPDKLYYEVSNLSTRESYEAWVTASTRIGQGESTPVIKMIPSSNVPAAIVSFGRAILVPYKEDVKLDCRYVGQPAPKAEWKIINGKE